MSKNPLLKKKFDEGYSEGFRNGFEQGKYSACVYFARRFEEIQKVKGIGPKTMKIIEEYFETQEYKEIGNGNS